MFKQFQRLDTTLATPTPGSGLGLSIARGLARGMRGDLTYRPGPRGGSRFRIELPLSNLRPPHRKQDRTASDDSEASSP